MPAINGVGIDDFNANFIKYLPEYVDLQKQSSFIRNLPLRKIEWEGSEIQEHLKVQQNTGWGFMQDGGKWPVAGKQNYVPAKYGRRMIGGSVKITLGQGNNAKTTKNAAVTVVDSELEGLMDTVSTGESFFAYRDGTGKVATLGATVSGSYITISDNPAMVLRDGDYELRDATTPTTIHDTFSAAKVRRTLSSGETRVDTRATLAASGQADGDGIYWAPGGLSSYGIALTGMQALIDNSLTGTFQGITLSDYPEYVSVVFNGGGSTQDMSTALFRRMLAALGFTKNKPKAKNLMVCTSVWDAVTFEELFEGSLRTVPDTRVGGIDVPTFQSSFGKFSLQSEAFAPYGEMYFIDRNELSMPEQAPFDWVRDPGGGVLRTSHEVAVYTGVAYGQYDLAVHNRQCMGKITNLRYEAQVAY